MRFCGVRSFCFSLALLLPFLLLLLSDLHSSGLASKVLGCAVEGKELVLSRALKSGTILVANGPKHLNGGTENV